MTQNERVLEHLKEHGGITHLEAEQLYGIMRLASRIADLKGMGIPIESRMTKGKNRFGEPTRFSTYYISTGG